MSRRIAAFIDGLRLPWAEALAAARRLGLGGIQFTPAGPTGPDALDAGARRALSADLAAHGLVPTALCGDLGGHAFHRPAERAARRTATAQILDLAGDLGCPVVSAHIGVIPEDRQHPRWDAIATALAQVGADADARGVRYAIETGPERSAVLRDLLDRIACPGLAVNFDPANLIMVQGEDAIPAWRTLAPWVVHVHAKDGVRHQPCDAEEVYAAFAEGGFAALEARTGTLFAETPLGAGSVDWASLLPVMHATGYRGWLTIERETGPDPVADVAAAVGFLSPLITIRDHAS